MYQVLQVLRVAAQSQFGGSPESQEAEEVQRSRFRLQTLASTLELVLLRNAAVSANKVKISLALCARATTL